jgi:hypothetical protein
MPLFKLLYPLLGLYWVAVALVLIVWRKRLYRDTGVIARPTAYSVELESRRRYFSLLFWILVLAFVPTYTMLSYARFRGPVAVWVLTVLGAALTLLGILNAYKQIRAIRRLHMKRENRLLVADRLAGHMSFEHRLFHDVPVERGVCVDHVLVGPNGVFAIETGPGRIAGHDKTSVVTVEGSALHFARDIDLPDTYSMAGALEGARWLQMWLAAKAREYVAVQPILVLPGWQIEITKDNNCNIRVLNEEGLQTLFSGARILQPTLVHRIADELARKCHERPTETSVTSGTDTGPARDSLATRQ